MADDASVAIACCRRTVEAGPEDLYPDPDSELLRNELIARGFSTELVSWDNPNLDWSARAAVVTRSTWDSVDRPGEFVDWARRVEALTTLLNPADVVAWNLDKRYLLDLELAGVGVIETQWVRPGVAWSPPRGGDYVVKPAVSAGGRETARYGPDHEADARVHVDRLVAAGHTVMVQPFLPSVVEPGELSLIFIDGTYSHAVRKGSVLEAGAGVVERPWERMIFLGLSDPTDRQRAVADAVVGVIHDRFAQSLVYSRVDLIDGAGGDPLVLEVELIDPNLSLGLSPAATSALADAIAARVALVHGDSITPSIGT